MAINKQFQQLRLEFAKDLFCSVSNQDSTSVIAEFTNKLSNSLRALERRSRGASSAIFQAGIGAATLSVPRARRRPKGSRRCAGGRRGCRETNCAHENGSDEFLRGPLRQPPDRQLSDQKQQIARRYCGEF
jgi:hypothetical protein